MNGAADWASESAGWDTTFHLRRAVDGNTDSLGAVVARLAPLLLATAEYRLGARLRHLVDPEDLVGEAWLVALPHLANLERRDGRMTPVLLKFLTTTINHRINNLLRRRILGQTGGGHDGTAATQASSEASGAITRAVRRETQEMVRACLDELDPHDREIILLRGIEQNASKTVATLLGLTVAAVDKRYSRALRRLRQRLPASVFDELEEPEHQEP